MRASSLVAVVCMIGCGGNVASGPVADAGDAGPDTFTSPDDGIPDRPDGATPTTPGVVPPTRPPTTAAGGATKWFAVKTLKLGITNLSGVADTNAWKQYGYDLDSRTTSREDSKTSANSCKRKAGSPTMVLTDGELGRDNNFGQHVMSVIRSLKADAEEAVNGTISDGTMTMLLRLDNVAGDDNAKVPGALYLGRGTGGLPRWDGNDEWAIDSSTVDSSKLPRTAFPNGYMRGGVWVSGDFGTGTMTVPLALIGRIDVPLTGGVISFNTKTNSNGVIAGASHTGKFEEALMPAFKSFGICPGNATYDQVVSTLTSSADLVSGAPLLQDTTRECDSISVGLGFTVGPIKPATTITTPAPPPPDECSGFADAG